MRLPDCWMNEGFDELAAVFLPKVLGSRPTVIGPAGNISIIGTITTVVLFAGNHSQPRCGSNTHWPASGLGGKGGGDVCGGG